MSKSTGNVPYGAKPWHQTSWDWRAAGNFIGGGVGSGLLVFTVLSPAEGVTRAVLLLLGVACIGAGLGSVALELGRPLRALNVFRNPRTSWMSREAIVGAVLAVCAILLAAGVGELRWVVGVLALAFVYCQARILRAARGIPGWREPLIVPLIVLTGLAEGGGLFNLFGAWHGGTPALLAAFAALVLLRALVWRIYRERLRTASPQAAVALAPAARALYVAGTLVPVALLLVGFVTGPESLQVLAAIAGVFALLAGSYTKFTILTRAGFNQGFRLAELPVRGARA